MDELRKKVIETFWKFYDGNLPPDEFADEIFAQFEEKGWIPPEEVKSIPPLRKVRWGWCVKPNTNCQGPDCEGCEFLRV